MQIQPLRLKTGPGLPYALFALRGELPAVWDELVGDLTAIARVGPLIDMDVAGVRPK